jgi:phosphatidylserine/phosphatidylglycerophosphate/cardiolipin synthase-like enzyme
MQLPSLPLLTYAIHEKIMVVDGTRAIVGGRNLEDKYFTYWMDLDLYLEGPVVGEIQAGFLRSWEEFSRNSRQELTPVQLSDKDPEPAGDLTVRFVQSRPWLGEYQPLEMLVTAFQMARERICVSSQYLVLPESLLRSALVDAAQRGVEVHVLTNSYTTGLEVGFSAGHHITLRYSEPLLDAGVRIYEMIGPEAEEMPKPYMHAKQFLVDGAWAAVGSFNLSMRSCFIESENLVVVQEPGFAGEMEAEFLDRVRRHATEMTRDSLNEQKEKFRTQMAMTNYLDLFF